MKEQEIRKLLAGKLRQFRQRANLTAKEVGEWVGKSEKTVLGWEHGRGQPDADTLFRLCEIYEIKSIAEFYSENDTENEETISSEEIILSDEKELLTIYRSMNDTGRSLLLSTARTFAGNSDMKKEAYSKSAI